MRDLIFGYIFIFVAIIGFAFSVFIRKQRLARRIQDLQEELRDSRPR